MPSSLTLYRAPLLPGNDLGNATTETQMPNGRGTPLILPLPSNGSLVNKRFRVVVAGRVQTTINTSFTLNLYFGLAATITSNTQLLTTNAVSVNNINSNFSVWLDLFWDSTQRIDGTGEGQVANNPVGRNALVNVITGVDPNRDSNTFLQSGATYGFTATGTFANSSTGNHAFVDIFDLELQ